MDTQAFGPTLSQKDAKGKYLLSCKYLDFFYQKSEISRDDETVRSGGMCNRSKQVIFVLVGMLWG